MKKILIAAVLGLPQFVLAASELVVNGSFEANAQAAGSWSTQAGLTGWESGSRGVELRNDVAGSAQSGDNFVELDSHGNSYITQDLMGSVIGRVELSFWYSARPETDAGTNGLQVVLGGHTVDLAGTENTTGEHAWVRYTGQFDLTAAGGDTLTFKALGRSDSYGTSLDQISVTLVPFDHVISAVPEPATVSLVLAGLGVVGLMARRRF